MIIKISCNLLLLLFQKNKRIHPKKRLNLVPYQIKKCLSLFIRRKFFCFSCTKKDDRFSFTCKTFEKDRTGSHDKRALQRSIYLSAFLFGRLSSSSFFSHLFANPSLRLKKPFAFPQISPYKHLSKNIISMLLSKFLNSMTRLGQCLIR